MGGLGQPPYRKQRPGRLARTCKGDNRARTTGCLRVLAGRASWRLSPAAGPAAGGPPSPALPLWPTGSPVPGPRKEHQGHKGTGPGSLGQHPGLCSQTSCVALDASLCLPEPRASACHGDSDAALLDYGARECGGNLFLGLECPPSSSPWVGFSFHLDIQGMAGTWCLSPRPSRGCLLQSLVWSHCPGEDSHCQAVWETHAYPGVNVGASLRS